VKSHGTIDATLPGPSSGSAGDGPVEVLSSEVVSYLSLWPVATSRRGQRRNTITTVRRG